MQRHPRAMRRLMRPFGPSAAAGKVSFSLAQLALHGWQLGTDTAQKMNSRVLDQVFGEGIKPPRKHVRRRARQREWRRLVQRQLA